MNLSESEEGRDIVRIIILSYVACWLLEGALRKWGLSSLQQPLYFLRVPIVGAAVVFALRQYRNKLPTAAIVTFCAVLVILSFGGVHVIMGDQSVTQAILGSRLSIELFLTPLAVAPWVRPKHAVAVCRFLVATAVPVAVLSLVQVISLPSALVNKLLADDGTDNFTNAGGVVRATGLFTSSSGHAYYIVLAAAALIALQLSGERSRIDSAAAVAAAPAIAVMMLTSGSRSAIFGVCFVLLVSLPFIFFQAPAKIPKMLVVTLSLGYAAWYVAPILAPDAMVAVLIRLLGDGMGGEANGRTFEAFIGWYTQAQFAPTFGFGLGATAQGLGSLGKTNISESELGQWVLQMGPPIFLLVLCLRIAAWVKLTAIAMRATARGRLGVAPLVAAGLWVWMVGTTTNQGSTNGYAVICAILVLAYRADARNPIALNGPARRPEPSQAPASVAATDGPRFRKPSPREQFRKL